MSVAAAQADTFIEEIIGNAVVWTIRDAEGFATATNASGEKAMPFWSKETRARAVIDKLSAYHGFRPHKLTLIEFTERWLPGLQRDGLSAGLNWSGEHATGYDISPSDVLARIKSATG